MPTVTREVAQIEIRERQIAVPNRLPSIALALLALAAGRALACPTTPKLTDEEQFTEASAVFVAHVSKTEEVSASFGGVATQGPTVEATVQLIEVLKGAPPIDGIVRDRVASPDYCGLPLFAGLDYVFFLSGDNGVLLPGATKGFFTLQGMGARQLLEKLRKFQSDSGK